MSTFQTVYIETNGGTESIYCENIEDDIFRCEESSLNNELITYGCKIEAKEVDGKLKFVRLIKESPFKVYRYLCSKEILESKNGIKMRDAIVSFGGDYEIIMGGFIFIHLPKEKENEIDNLINILKGQDE